jgi:hypothetical protein
MSVKRSDWPEPFAPDISETPVSHSVEWREPWWIIPLATLIWILIVAGLLSLILVVLYLFGVRP